MVAAVNVISLLFLDTFFEPLFVTSVSVPSEKSQDSLLKVNLTLIKKRNIPKMLTTITRGTPKTTKVIKDRDNKIIIILAVVNKNLRVMAKTTIFLSSPRLHRALTNPTAIRLSV
jgi:hypothetical protein